MDENNTDKDLLSKGIKQMLLCVVLMFSGPTMLHFVLKNDNKSFFTILLIISIILCISAIILMFIGINTILNSMFKKKK